MNNFTYSVPTEIYFGRGQVKNLGEIAARYGASALLVYGGGSIRKNGIYDAVTAQLKSRSIRFVELPGVEPNPKIASVRKGVQLCRENNLELVLAVGGGSSIDCAKIVAAGTCYGGDAWDLVTDSRRIRKALPIVTVLTMSATGSEMNGNAVITNPETNEKLGAHNPLLKPKASILDPEYTFSLPKIQTAAGTADIMSHIFESYFNNVPGAFLQTRFAESLLKACIHYGPAALKNSSDYEARANLMWASSLAINGLISDGCDVAWSVHAMEHELSAFYDITHGVGLAILTPFWMEHVLNRDTAGKFAEYGINVWGLEPSSDPSETAEKAIGKTRAFFKSLGLPSTLREVGIGEEKLGIMAEKAARHGLKDAFVPLEKDDVLAIFRAAL